MVDPSEEGRGNWGKSWGVESPSDTRNLLIIEDLRLVGMKAGGNIYIYIYIYSTRGRDGGGGVQNNNCWSIRTLTDGD